MKALQSHGCDDLMNACSHDEFLEKEVEQQKENNNNENEGMQSSLHPEENETPGLLRKVSSPHKLSHQLPPNSIPNSFGNASLEEPFLNKKNLSSSFAEELKRQQERKHSELISHRSDRNRDFDEANFKELLSTKANVAKTITYHDKHRKKHKLKQKRLDGNKNWG